MTGTRGKILTEGVRLFAENGYRETTIGDIEAAAGLAPRAGGFYRHFKSKEELLYEMLESYFQEIDEELTFRHVFPLGDTKSELLLIGRTILNHAERHRDLRNVLLRGARYIPKINELLSSINQQGAYAEIVPWLKQKLGTKRCKALDTDAFAVVVFAPVFYTLRNIDQKEEPLGVDRERVLNTWANQWAPILDHG